MINSNRKDSPVIEHVDEDGILGMKCYLGGCRDDELVSLSIVDVLTSPLANVPERIKRQQPRPTNTTMGNYDNQDDLAATMQQMQQQMLQMQQTIQAQQEAALLTAQQHQEQ
ncbi:hypothetical protein F2Q68_00017939 [Brassica cretica]|uniref:Uncharacterized protein n=2 Tax=Brassica cretica TaxID=69181 RepID=A0ABQ7D1Z6_BRACR|nr:hypothetical protein F2Q68_00017939 [Brassica cretica]KAF3565750.1 hypothetical protein DY000_02015010 [Brassica cretica]